MRAYPPQQASRTGNCASVSPQQATSLHHTGAKVRLVRYAVRGELNTTRCLEAVVMRPWSGGSICCRGTSTWPGRARMFLSKIPRYGVGFTTVLRFVKNSMPRSTLERKFAPRATDFEEIIYKLCLICILTRHLSLLDWCVWPPSSSV